MNFRDAIGNEINEGDTLSLAIGNELGAGTVVKLVTGLGLTDTEPAIFIQVLVPRPAFKNGVVPGVLKVASPQTTPTLVEA